MKENVSQLTIWILLGGFLKVLENLNTNNSIKYEFYALKLLFSSVYLGYLVKVSEENFFKK